MYIVTTHKLFPRHRENYHRWVFTTKWHKWPHSSVCTHIITCVRACLQTFLRDLWAQTTCRSDEGREIGCSILSSTRLIFVVFRPTLQLEGRTLRRERRCGCSGCIRIYIYIWAGNDAYILLYYHIFWVTL